MLPLFKFLIVLSLLNVTNSLEDWNQILNDDFDGNSKWRNPNDMGFDPSELDSLDSKGHLTEQGDVHKEKALETEDNNTLKPVEEIQSARAQPKMEISLQTSIEKTFILRHVRQLLKVLKLEDVDITDSNSVLKFDAKLQLTIADVRKLRQFADELSIKKFSQKERLGLLHDVDAILNGFIVDVTPEKEFDFSDLAEDYTTLLQKYLPSSQDLFWAILMGGGVGLVYLLKIGLPLWKWLFMLLSLSSLWHWGHLYKKALLKKQIALMSSTQIPEECFKQKSWFDFFSSGSQKCSEYHDALLVDPLWEVTPTMAVAETVTLMLIQPMEALGLHLGKFFSALLANLSWLSALPVLVFVFLFIFLIIVMLFGYKIKLPFLLASIEPQPNSYRQSAKQVELEQKVEELQRKLDLKRESDLQAPPAISAAAKMVPIAMAASSSNQEASAAETSECGTCGKETLPEKPSMEELMLQITELTSTVRQLKINQACEPTSEVATLQAAVEVLPEDRKEEEESPSRVTEEIKTSDIREQIEDTKEASPEDFEWVNSSLMIAK